MLQTLKSVLILPPTVSEVEQRHVDRINKIVLIFFALHVPVFMGVAALCGTGPLKALLLTTACLIGPVLAWKGLPSRQAALVNGFAAMCFGGLLVHFGQGPMQIEMHFYFFVLLGLLAVYGNPMVILVAAVTVAVHHLLIYFLLPTSVFNYEASIWVVLVHALFVVLQTPAAAWIARAFFDNVIGLELIVQERTKALDARNNDMRLLLDNCGQGFLTLNAQGQIAAERSAAVGRWLGEAPVGTPFADMLAERAPETGAWFELAWESVMDGLMPLELCLDQLPSALQLGERSLGIAYTPLQDKDGTLQSVLVVLTDRSAALAQAASEEHQRELMAIFGHLISDRNSFLSFVDEGEAIIARVQDPSCSPVELQRRIHTLKGSGSLFGLQRLAAACHAAETELVDEHALSAAKREAVLSQWADLAEDLQELTGAQAEEVLALTQAEYLETLAAVEHQQPHAELAKRMHAWRMEPTEGRLERLAQQAQRIAQRIGKEVSVETVSNGLRVSPDTWRSFWTSMVHALRNAADHGIEDAGVLRLETRVEAGAFRISLQDDGPGVNWDRIRLKAQEMGLPTKTHEDLKAALFADGLSTREVATETSGRGVGMAALLEATKALGGEIEIDSAPGQGTTVQFVFPEAAMHREACLQAAA